MEIKFQHKYRDRRRHGRTTDKELQAPVKQLKFNPDKDEPSYSAVLAGY